jgi:hypothetical protein
LKDLKKYQGSFIIGIVTLIFWLSPLKQFMHPKTWFIFAFFVNLDFLVHTLAEKGMENKSENFIQFYMVSMVAKLVFSIVFTAIFLYLYPLDRKALVLTVLAFYLCFTVFEILIIIRKLRRN